jgi:hypothetical protein
MMDENTLHRKGKVTTVEERAASEEETPELVEIDIGTICLKHVWVAFVIVLYLISMRLHTCPGTNCTTLTTPLSGQQIPGSPQLILYEFLYLVMF